jgi:hypothetical protein
MQFNGPAVPAPPVAAASLSAGNLTSNPLGPKPAQKITVHFCIAAPKIHLLLKKGCKVSDKNSHAGGGCTVSVLGKERRHGSRGAVSPSFQWLGPVGFFAAEPASYVCEPFCDTYSK